MQQGTSRYKAIRFSEARNTTKGYVVNTLSLHLLRYLLLEPSLGKGADKFISVVLRWSVLVDIHAVLDYLRSVVDVKRRDKPHLNIGAIPTWNQIEVWPEPRVRQELITWTMDMVIDEGFRSSKPPEINGNLGQRSPHDRSERWLSQQLALMTISEAVSCLTNVAIMWSWYLDAELVKADAISDGRYEEKWSNKDFVKYVFFTLHEMVFSNLLQHTFTEQFIEQWRK